MLSRHNRCAWQKLSSITAAIWRPFPTPVPSPTKKPNRIPAATFTRGLSQGAANNKKEDNYRKDNNKKEDKN